MDATVSTKSGIRSLNVTEGFRLFYKHHSNYIKCLSFALESNVIEHIHSYYPKQYTEMEMLHDYFCVGYTIFRCVEHELVPDYIVRSGSIFGHPIVFIFLSIIDL